MNTKTNDEFKIANKKFLNDIPSVLLPKIIFLLEITASYFVDISRTDVFIFLQHICLKSNEYNETLLFSRKGIPWFSFPRGEYWAETTNRISLYSPRSDELHRLHQGSSNSFSHYTLINKMYCSVEDKNQNKQYFWN